MWSGWRLWSSLLEDICAIVHERGYPVRRYIQDHTLVEDTESSVGLVTRGWKIYCYPERLSYSATPPDFGSLIIQRRRWANGPLLIVPKLLRYGFRGQPKSGRIFRFTLLQALELLIQSFDLFIRLRFEVNQIGSRSLHRAQ
jgi:cellulose synthase/poly-beta-1,6-N-acetylglucosamine synthase-like glycosyltransferase